MVFSRRGDECRTSPEDLHGKRSGIALRTMLLSTGVTVLIGIIETAFWIFSRNNLFLIEGAGNLAWLIPDLIMLGTIRIGRKKPDWMMNHGYRRTETIFLLFFSLGIAGFVIHILYDIISRGPEQLPSQYGAATVLLSLTIIITLVFLCRYTHSVGKAIKSRLLMLDSIVIWLDVASAVVLLLSGIFLVVAPSIRHVQFILTMVVGLSLLVYSLNEVVEAARELIDASPSRCR